VRLARAEGLPPPMLIFILARLGAARRAVFDLPAARALHQEAAALAEGPGLRWWFREMVAAELCADHAAAGDWAAAAAQAETALAARDGALPFVALIAAPAIEALARAGAVADAETRLARFRAHVGESDRLRLSYYCAVAAVLRARADAHETRALEVTASLAAALDLPGQAWPTAARLATLYAAAGYAARARDSREQAARLIRELGDGVPDAADRARFLAAASAFV
jgi:hypothetical protein